MKMKKALEELGKALEDLVEVLGEDQQSQQPPAGCVHDVDEAQVNRRSASKGALPSLGHSSSNPSRAGLQAICAILSALTVIQWIKSLLIAKSLVFPKFQHS
jgi:hypothetical protein